MKMGVVPERKDMPRHYCTECDQERFWKPLNWNDPRSFRYGVHGLTPMQCRECGTISTDVPRYAEWHNPDDADLTDGGDQ
jgi:hypothetical protein